MRHPIQVIPTLTVCHVTVRHVTVCHVTVCHVTVKELYNGLPDLLTQVAHEELEKLPGVTECNITYLPQVTWMYIYVLVERVGKISRDLLFL